MAAAAVSICFFLILLLGGLSLYISRESLSVQYLRPPPFNLSSTDGRPAQIIDSESVLFPDWIVFNIVEPQPAEDDFSSAYKCVFQNTATSPAVYAGTLSTSGRRAFKCTAPDSVREFKHIVKPALTKSEVNATDVVALNWTSRSHLTQWNRLVYDSLSTDKDVVVFAKKVNRYGHIRSPSTLRCVFLFTDESSNQQVRIKTPVTSSDQEVFRCLHPPSHRLPEGSRISLTLELMNDEGRRMLIPSVASYVNRLKTTSLHSASSATLCVCTMVHNVNKFLKEWVMYHSAIGVEKFILYDNDSDESLDDVVAELAVYGYEVETVFWPWPKTQEAGFSHSVQLSKTACEWMIFVDVDEFVFSPKWSNRTKPSSDMLLNLLPTLNNVSDQNNDSAGSKQVGQVMIRCHDFGPSNQTSHPKSGVTQGYTCRRKLEERHKSIVLLAAVNESLQNSVHHFNLKSDVYTTEKMSVEKAVVNHYKYQAWSEFKTKFKRRVSTYVVDWTENANLGSKDRTPGLGVEAVEPEGWAMKFCEVLDTRLQLLTQKWFGRRTDDQSSSVKMAWER